MKRTILALAVALSFISPAVAQTSDPKANAIIQKMETAGRGIKSLQANIVQEKYDKNLGETERSEGTLYFKAGAEGQEKVLLDFTKPVKESVSVIGDRVLIYQPATNQAFKTTRAKGAQKNSSLGFLGLGYQQAGSQLRDRFLVTYLSDETVAGRNASILDLKPKGQENFTKMMVWVDAQTGMPIQYVIFGKDNSRTTVTLSNVRNGVKLDDGRFEIKIPSGTNVSEG
jgi:outer membrane lipoprotein-sorting protein